MSNINPSASVPSSVPPKAGLTTLAAINNPPPAIAKLAAGTVLVGTVTRQEPSGQTFLRTEHGQLTLTTRLPLPTGAEVKLEVQAVGARMQAIILSVGGQPPSNAAVPPAPQGAPPAGGKAAPPPGSPPGEARPAMQPAPAGTAVQTAAPASAPQGTVIAATLHPGPNNAAINAGAAASRAIPLQIVPLYLAAPSGVPQGTLPTIPMATAPAGGTVLSGTILGANGQGGLLLQTPLGQLTLPVRAELPAGAVLTFELLDPPPQRTAGPEQAERTALRMSAEWTGLKEAIGALAKNDPIVQATLLNGILPKPGADLVAKLFHFFSALSKGEIRDWLGEQTLRSIERAGNGALAQQLSDEFSQLSRLALRGGDEWRTILFPILHESELHQAKLFLRHHDDDQDGSGNPETGTRIIVEISLNRLGDVQLDGLYHVRRFDLILRTQNPLPAFMTTEIRSIFEGCCGACGLKGDILFRENEPFAPTPLRKASGMPATDLGLEV